MKKISLLCFVATLFLFLSCLKDKTTPIDPTSCTTIVSYSLDIVPIIEQSCANSGSMTDCHGAWIHDYNQITASIVAGAWENSIFNLKTMPKIPNPYAIDSLTAEDYQIMKCWVNQGYPEN